MTRNGKKNWNVPEVLELSVGLTMQGTNPQKYEFANGGGSWEETLAKHPGIKQSDVSNGHGAIILS